MESGRPDETRIILVRHGHVEDNSSNGSTRLCGWLDSPLSARGREQAVALARSLTPCLPVECLYSSTLRRSRQTARYLAAVLRVTPRFLRSLREINCGRLEGWRLADIQRLYPDVWQCNFSQEDDEFRWPGGESYAHFRRRVMRVMRRIAGGHRGGSVLVVTHAGVINQIFGSIHGTRPARWEPYRPSNASISEISWKSDGTVRVVRFDQRAGASEGTP